MPDCKNFNRSGPIINQVKNAVVADANTVAIVTLEFLNTMRARVVFEFE